MENHKTLDKFIKNYELNSSENVSIVNSKDVAQLNSAGYSTEEFLDYVIQKRKYISS